MRLNQPKKVRRKRSQQNVTVDVDVEALLSIESRCEGCGKGERCCCSSYEVCVTAPEMKRIIKILPEVSKYCPHLLTSGGYDNVFEAEEPGLFSIDVTEDGLCLFAYWSNRRIHCALHSAAVKLGLPLAQVKPKVCLLWPMQFTEGAEVLTVIDDAFLFACNVKTGARSRCLSPGFVDAIEMVYGEGCGNQVLDAAANGDRRTMLVIRK
jgi:hypothetical protein